jgi:hypothetical protein
VPLIANWIARAAGRSVGLSGRAILLELGREAQRQYRARPRPPLDPMSAASIPRNAFVRAVYLAWLCGLAAFALVVLNVHLFLPDGKPVAGFLLAVGAILFVEGLGLVMKRFPFRRLLLTRLTARSHRSGGRLRQAGWPRLVGAALTRARDRLDRSRCPYPFTRRGRTALTPPLQVVRAIPLPPGVSEGHSIQARAERL